MTSHVCLIYIYNTYIYTHIYIYISPVQYYSALNHRKERNFANSNNLDGPRRYYSPKLETERQILCGFTYMCNPKRKQMYKYNKTET